MPRKLSRQRRLQLAVNKLKPKTKPKPTLEILPAEIIHDICAILALEDKSSCSCLSRSAKFMYIIATPYLYRNITTEGLRSVRGEKLAALLRTMVYNEALASLITDINFFSTPREIIPFDTGRYSRTFEEAACRVGKDVLSASKSGINEWMAHVIAFNTPYLRSLQYRLTSDEDYVLWATLLTAALETHQDYVLFPYLRKVAIGSTGGKVLHADWLLQLLFDAAPNIQELTLDGLFKAPSPNKRFRHLTTLYLSNQILFAQRDLESLIRSCPKLRSFALTYTRFKRTYQYVGPQSVVDMLEPLAGQLTELRLKLSVMWLRPWGPIHERPANVSLSFKSLRALEVLEIDAACCWPPLLHPHDTVVIPLWGRAGCLVESLPAGLREITFAAIDEQLGTVRSGRTTNVNEGYGYEIGEYDREHSIDGLVRFARGVKQHCPRLHSVRYGYNPKFDACLKRELLKLQHVFVEEGIAFSSESLYPHLYPQNNDKDDKMHRALKTMRKMGAIKKMR